VNTQKNISIVCALVVGLSLTIIACAWATKQLYEGSERFSEQTSGVISFVADLPHRVKDVVSIYVTKFRPLSSTNPYSHLEVDNNQRSNIIGFVLNAYVDNLGASRIALIDLKTGTSEEVLVCSKKSGGDTITDRLKESDRYRHSAASSNYRASHPLVSDKGVLYYILPWNDLIAIDLKSKTEIWRVTGSFHHSIETDCESNLWLCAAIEPKIKNSNKNSGQHLQYEDQALVQISPSGKIIESISVTELILNSKLEFLLFGCSNPLKNKDPIHLNHILPIKEDSGILRKGCLLISLRNLSTVMMVDPNNKAVVWHKTGPWMNQHCVIPMNTSEISVLDNHSFPYASRLNWLRDEWQSRIMVYNLTTGTSKYVETMENLDLRISGEGRAFNIPGGNWLLEDSMKGTLLIFRKGRLAFKWSNVYPNKEVGYTSWCRYVETKPF